MARRLNLHILPDADLLAACKRHPWERRIDNIGCGAALAAGVLAASGLLFWQGSGGLFAAVIAFFAVGISLAAGTSRLVNFRSRPSQDELRRRYGLPELPQSDTDAEKFFTGDTPPDAVLLLRGQGLPHGNAHFVRVRLWNGSPAYGTVTAQTLSAIDFSRDVPFIAEKREAALTAEECSALWARLPESFASSPESVNAAFEAVYDGFPCTLAAITREPLCLRLFHGNLAAVCDADAPHPVPALMEALLTAGEAAGVHPVQFG
jgi:hypothetical protein